MTLLYDISSEQPLKEILITIDHLINDDDISPSNQDILKQIQFAFSDVNENFRYLFVNVHQGDKLPQAYFFGRIVAGNLSPSDDPNDASVPRSVLATNGLTQSNHQFNWKQAGNGPNAVRTSIVIFGPGDGATGHTVIVDHDDDNINMMKLEAQEASAVMTSKNIVRNYGTSGLKLQTGEWRVNASSKWEFWPSSMSAGTYILLRQFLPPVVIA